MDEKEDSSATISSGAEGDSSVGRLVLWGSSGEASSSGIRAGLMFGGILVMGAVTGSSSIYSEGTRTSLMTEG